MLSEPTTLLSHVLFFEIPWTVAHQAPPSTEFSRQEYQSVLPFPSPGDLPYPGIEPRSPALQATGRVVAELDVTERLAQTHTHTNSHPEFLSVAITVGNTHHYRPVIE